MEAKFSLYALLALSLFTSALGARHSLWEIGIDSDVIDPPVIDTPPPSMPKEFELDDPIRLDPPISSKTLLSKLNSGFGGVYQQVPFGPDPIKPPPTPDSSKTLFSGGVDRQVPFGADPIKPPPTAVDRQVPFGADLIEPPPTPVSSKTLFYGGQVPFGPGPIEPPPTPVSSKTLFSKFKGGHSEPVNLPPMPATSFGH